MQPTRLLVNLSTKCITFRKITLIYEMCKIFSGKKRKCKEMITSNDNLPNYKISLILIVK